MMPIADNLNITELKAEQIIQGITPDGIAIDIDALAEVDLGDEKMQTVQQTLNMYLQKVVTYTVPLLLMGIQCLKPSRRFKPETVLIN
jgi:hypothetical protein